MKHDICVSQLLTVDRSKGLTKVRVSSELFREDASTVIQFYLATATLLSTPSWKHQNTEVKQLGPRLGTLVVRRGCCSYKYCQILKAKKQGLHYMLLYCKGR